MDIISFAKKIVLKENFIIQFNSNKSKFAFTRITLLHLVYDLHDERIEFHEILDRLEIYFP